MTGSLIACLAEDERNVEALGIASGTLDNAASNVFLKNANEVTIPKEVLV